MVHLCAAETKTDHVSPIVCEVRCYWLLSVKDGSEEYKLKQHGTCDIGCYLYLKDVERIEHISKSLGDNFGKGYAIMLTNDHLYWDKPKTTPDTTAFSDFRIYDGRTIPAGQKLNWHPSSNSQPSWQKKMLPFTLIHGYTIDWKDYSNLIKEKEGDANGEAFPFKYSIIEIN